MVLIGILAELRIIERYESDFAAACGERVPIREPVPDRIEPGWKRTLRIFFFACFLFVWLAGVAAAWTHSLTMRGGTPEPTAQNTEELSVNNFRRYVTPEANIRASLVTLAFFAGVGFMLLFALVLRLCGVPWSPDSVRSLP